jgi:hypothetical protein
MFCRSPRREGSKEGGFTGRPWRWRSHLRGPLRPETRGPFPNANAFESAAPAQLPISAKSTSRIRTNVPDKSLHSCLVHWVLQKQQCSVRPDLQRARRMSFEFGCTLLQYTKSGIGIHRRISRIANYALESNIYACHGCQYQAKRPRVEMIRPERTAGGSLTKGVQ